MPSRKCCFRVRSSLRLIRESCLVSSCCSSLSICLVYFGAMRSVCSTRVPTLRQSFPDQNRVKRKARAVSGLYTLTQFNLRRAFSARYATGAKRERRGWFPRPLCGRDAIAALHVACFACACRAFFHARECIHCREVVLSFFKRCSVHGLIVSHNLLALERKLRRRYSVWLARDRMNNPLAEAVASLVAVRNAQNV